MIRMPNPGLAMAEMPYKVLVFVERMGKNNR